MVGGATGVSEERQVNGGTQADFWTSKTDDFLNTRHPDFLLAKSVGAEDNASIFVGRAHECTKVVACVVASSRTALALF